MSSFRLDKFAIFNWQNLFECQSKKQGLESEYLTAARKRAAFSVALPAIITRFPYFLRHHFPMIHSLCSSCKKMKLSGGLRSLRVLPTLSYIKGSLQSRTFQPEFVPRDPNAKPRRYKYPPFYDPYGPRQPPSNKVIQLAEKIATLPPEERIQLGPTLIDRLRHPKMQPVSVEGMDLGPHGGASAGPLKTEEKKTEKTVFNVKLEKFDAAAKIKVIKEVRAFTNLGLKEAKDLVEKVPAVLKQGITKEEGNDIIDKIKAAGGVAVME